MPNVVKSKVSSPKPALKTAMKYGRIQDGSVVGKDFSWGVFNNRTTGLFHRLKNQGRLQSALIGKCRTIASPVGDGSTACPLGVFSDQSMRWLVLVLVLGLFTTSYLWPICGTKSRGRQRTKYTDSLNDFVTRKESHKKELIKRTDNKENWKAMISDVCNRPGT